MRSREIDFLGGKLYSGIESVPIDFTGCESLGCTRNWKLGTKYFLPSLVEVLSGSVNSLCGEVLRLLSALYLRLNMESIPERL